MIAVLLTMVRARWGQALTVFLLSVIATAAAVAGPAALRAVDAAVVRNEVAHATTAERSITLQGAANPSDPAAASGFDSVTNLLEMPGFTTIRSGETRIFGPVPAGDPRLTRSTVRLAFRDGLCAHVVIVSGRCLAGSLDLLVGVDTAVRNGVRAGDLVDVQAERVGQNGQLLPDGAVSTLTVAGTYRPRDPNELYWAAQYYFPLLADGTRDETAFVGVPTFDLIDHTVGQSIADSVAGPDSLTPENLADLDRDVTALTARAESGVSGFTLTTSIPDLLERIKHGQALAHELVPVAFLPLVALAWFVVFLAVGYGVNGRRHELGLVNLRGVRLLRRWWLALGETVVVIVLGAPVGLLVGYLVVDVIARLELGGATDATIGPAELPYAGIALAGALLVALLGQRRALREPVVEALRGVPRAAGRWQSFVVEGALVVLAGLGVVQLRSADSGLTGVALVVPSLVVAAVTLLAARAFVPAAGLIARTALRTGRLGAGLAAVQIARRPGSQRLFALVAVATGLLAFVAAGQSVAAEARDQRATVTVGAARVLNVDRASTPRLVYVTRQVDPTGTWAMAVVPVHQAEATSPPVLAVDTARLGRVADWRPEFGVPVEKLVNALTPPAQAPFVLRGNEFSVDFDRTGRTGTMVDSDNDGIVDSPAPTTSAPFLVTFRFESLADGNAITAAVMVVPGRHTYPAQVSGCADGCRLTGFTANAGQGVGVALVLRGLRSGDADVVPPAALTESARWRGVGTTQVDPNADGGLRIVLPGDPFDPGDIVVSTVDAPIPVPVAVTTSTLKPRTITGVDGRGVGVKVVAAGSSLAMLPRLGTVGVLADLTYLQRVGLAAAADPGEVWLSEAAPPDAAERLRKAGLSILDSASAADARSALDQAGPALALRFHIAAAGLGIGLALGGLWLVAAVDRRRRADDLLALRRQGLRPRFIRRAALWGYLGLVVSSAAAGLGAALVAWWLTGDHLPVLTDRLAALPPPRWPVALDVVRPWAVAAVLLVVAAIAVAVVLRRTVNRNGKG